MLQRIPWFPRGERFWWILISVWLFLLGLVSDSRSRRYRSPPDQLSTDANFSGFEDGRIAPRSGLASKHMIDTGAGVIDADYRGQVKVLLFNHGEMDFEVKEGDRVAQLVLERIYTPEILEVQELEESVRGEAGFGSTG